MNTFASAHIPPHRHGYISMLLLSTSPYCSTAPQNRAALRRDYDRSTWEDLGTRSNMSSLAAQSHSKATEHHVARRLGQPHRKQSTCQKNDASASQQPLIGASNPGIVPRHDAAERTAKRHQRSPLDCQPLPASECARRHRSAAAARPPRPRRAALPSWGFGSDFFAQ